jgi:phosphatidylcholine synthase
MKPGASWAAAAVHLLTASGAVFGFLALAAAASGQWETAFAWLGVALIVDGLDGPLARRFDVKSRLARFSGETLDLVIDYLTYAVVPAFILYSAGLMPDGLATFGAALVLLSSLYHFADANSKTEDGFFVGFPALWNLFVLYAFIFVPAPAVVLAGVVAFTALTLVPLKWLHPVRVRSLRPVTLAVTVIWAAAAIAALVQGFPASAPIQIIFALAALYYAGLGLSRSFGPLGTRRTS